MEAKESGIRSYRENFLKDGVQKNFKLMDNIFKVYEEQTLQFYKHQCPRLNLSKYQMPALLEHVNQTKKQLFEELTYLSLALIQKSNFEEEFTRFRNRVLP